MKLENSQNSRFPSWNACLASRESGTKIPGGGSSRPRGGGGFADGGGAHRREPSLCGGGRFGCNLGGALSPPLKFKGVTK